MPLQIFGDFDFVGGQDFAPLPLQNSQICINFYPEINKEDPKEVKALLGCPGLIQLVAPPGGGVAVSSGDQVFDTTFNDAGVEIQLEETITFKGDGTVTYFKNDGTPVAVPNWYTPTTTNIGASRFIRITELSGFPAQVTYTAGPALGSWVNITGGGQFMLIDSHGSSAGTYTGSIKVELSGSGTGPADASATWTFIFTIS